MDDIEKKNTVPESLELEDDELEEVNGGFVFVPNLPVGPHPEKSPSHSNNDQY